MGCTGEIERQWLWGPVERLVRQDGPFAALVGRKVRFGDGLRTMNLPEERLGLGLEGQD